MPAHHEEAIEIGGFDGARLTARAFARKGSALRAAADDVPLLLLPGHMRPARMLEPLAQALLLEGNGPRRILLVEFRGRGRSEPRKDAAFYTPYADARDVSALTDAMNWHHVDIFGSAHGGLVAMALAALRPTLPRRVILADIGPELDGVGLVRLKTMAARAAIPVSWEEAARDFKRQIGGRYPGLDDADFETLAGLSFDEKDGKPAPGVHPSLIEHYAAIDPDERYPTLWPEFRALRNRPVLLLKAENTDILNDGIVARMHEVHSGLMEETVPGQGHAPILWREDWSGRIAAFLS